jgi:hypothetical protein
LRALNDDHDDENGSFDDAEEDENNDSSPIEQTKPIRSRQDLDNIKTLLRDVLRREAARPIDPDEEELVGQAHKNVLSIYTEQPGSNDDETLLKPDPKSGWMVDRELAPHVRAALRGIAFENHELATRDTGFSVCTLGTGSGMGSSLRSNSATVIRNNNHSYLVDAGEGIQRQFVYSRLNYRDIRKIFSMCFVVDC